ncbi:MAG: DUF2179 domain-containing protein, partial [Eubacteriales bacterium]|nr:DUF2179 domain-containing protein [Eubacteriales bacterium]
GGTDILAIVYRRINRRLSVAQVIIVMDVLIILASAICYQQRQPGQIKLGLYSAMAMVITGACMDFVIEGFNYKRVAYVISDHNKDIARLLMENLDRGVTSISARGMYSDQDRSMLCCVLAHEQVPKLRTIVKMIDERAFVFVVDTREVYGEGFGGDEEF